MTEDTGTLPAMRANALGSCCEFREAAQLALHTAAAAAAE
jgi:hypothetical protein